MTFDMSESVIQKVKEYLKKNPYPKETLPQDIVGNGVRSDGDYLYIPISTLREAKSVFDYYNYLAKIEEAILDKEGQHVILVPCLDSEAKAGKAFESTV